MDDLLLRVIVVLVIAATATIIYLRYFSSYPAGRDRDPLILDARQDLGAIIEAGSIVEQRRSGRERGGDVTLLVNHKPGQCLEVDLNYRTLQRRAGRGEIKLDSSKPLK